ncbi:MAG: prolipoprotein diacylglyceryl transferase, partial [Clostridia bacterium]|nr:prolipoprotein diacylglyceryl transferase [Clostridia bacterium]
MDSTTVYFSFLDKGIEVSSILAQFSLFGKEVTIRWYGAIIAFGFLLAVLWGGRVAYKWKMNLDKMIDVLIAGTFGGIAGARLYYVIFRWEYYAAHPDEIIQIWNGGLAIYGGIIGALIAAFIVCKCNGLNFYNLLDCAGMSLLIGQGIGRWGNFANQEAFGSNTDMPWGMISEKTTIYLVDHKAELADLGVTVDPYSPVHPTFLYESLWCLGSFLIL